MIRWRHTVRSVDDEFFQRLALSYSTKHQSMTEVNICNENFKNGITNGAKWYPIIGSMQDFIYVNTNAFDITLELSCCKYPEAGLLHHFWQQNKKSLVDFILNTHLGVKGIVTYWVGNFCEYFSDIYNNPIENVKVYEIAGGKPVSTTKLGEFWRIHNQLSYILIFVPPKHMKHLDVLIVPLRADRNETVVKTIFVVMKPKLDRVWIFDFLNLIFFLEIWLKFWF